MTIFLASKPGISGATVLNIPKTWDPTWLRNFINNMLKGADVRNAVGANGISVTGNIASPYATIGFAAPVTIYAPVTIPGIPDSVANTLTIGGSVAGQITTSINNTSTANGTTARLAVSSGATSVALFAANAANTSQIVAGGPTGAQGVLRTLGAAPLVFGVNNQIIFELSGSLATASVQGWGPTAAAMVDMTPDVGTFTGTLTGFSSAVTGTMVWAKMGNHVVVVSPSGMGSSALNNSTSMTMTGLPAEIQPARAQFAPCVLEDNTTNVSGAAQLAAGSGTVTFWRSVVSGTAVTFSASGFTATGTKGLNITAFSYLLN
jgi:hypothetical protein